MSIPSIKNLYLKKLYLHNFRGHADREFDFTDGSGMPYQLISFFGPNGSGKTSILDAISMLSADFNVRNQEMLRATLNKNVRNPDYDTYQTLKIKNNVDMMIRGTYIYENKEYIVCLTQNGYERNDFAPLDDDSLSDEEKIEVKNSGPFGENHLHYRRRIAHFVQPDSDLNRFQLHVSCAKQFEEVVTNITRYKTECMSAEHIGKIAINKEYCTDFVIVKDENYRIHYKNMSMGERKICKSFSDLLNLKNSLQNPRNGEIAMPGWPRLLLLDEVERSIYYDRHVSMIDSLKHVFNEQQIFMTTHSGVLIPRFLKGDYDHATEKWFNLE